MVKMHAETHVGLHVKCLLLLCDFNQNWYGSTDFSETHQCEMSWKFVCSFLSCYLWTDRHSEGSRCIFAASHCGCIRNCRSLEVTKKREVTWTWRKLHCEGLPNSTLHLILLGRLDQEGGDRHDVKHAWEMDIHFGLKISCRNPLRELCIRFKGWDILALLPLPSVFYHATPSELPL
jgi:hypothetical protein